jgi:maspardin
MSRKRQEGGPNTMKSAFELHQLIMDKTCLYDIGIHPCYNPADSTHAEVFMRSKLKWIIPLVVLLMVVLVVYFFPVPQRSFNDLATNVDPAVTASLQTFREKYGIKKVNVQGKDWEYIDVGRGNNEAILFLHGMTGAYDIWWQQIDALKGDYRIVSVTYPAVNSLEEMDLGVMSILANERLPLVNIVGTSLGGYYAQYFVAKHPEHVLRAVFANTFPPNDLIKEKNGTIGALLPFLPNWLVMNTLRDSFQNSIYPASGNSDVTLAYLLEMSYGRMSKAQVAGRYHCVVDSFTPPDLAKQGPLALIIESDNDPLVEPALREQLKETYPIALVVTLENGGHFPYLSMPEKYTEILLQFLRSPILY